MSRRSLVQLVLVGLVAGLVLGAVIYFPRVSGYRSVVTQNSPVQFQSDEGSDGGPGQ